MSNALWRYRQYLIVECDALKERLPFDEQIQFLLLLSEGVPAMPGLPPFPTSPHSVSASAGAFDAGLTALKTDDIRSIVGFFDEM